MKYNFLLAKTFASPHTPGALFAHTISVSDALSHSRPKPSSFLVFAFGQFLVHLLFCRHGQHVVVLR